MNRPSNCTSSAIASYFLDGTLPPPGLECEPDLPPFEYGATLGLGSEADTETENEGSDRRR